MSTRQTYYYHKADKKTPKIHIYAEMDEEGLRMEIVTGCAVVDIPLPEDLKKWMGVTR